MFFLDLVGAFRNVTVKSGYLYWRTFDQCALQLLSGAINYTDRSRGCLKFLVIMVSCPPYILMIRRVAVSALILTENQSERHLSMIQSTITLFMNGFVSIWNPSVEHYQFAYALYNNYTKVEKTLVFYTKKLCRLSARCLNVVRLFHKQHG